MRLKSNNKLIAVDFFCSGGGMSFGLQQAGIKVVAGIDFDPYNVPIYWTTILGGYGRMKTYETSIPKTESVHRFSRPAGRKDFQAVQ